MRNTTSAAHILMILAAVSPANARTGHGIHGPRAHEMHGSAGPLATDRQHADGASTKAAAEEEDRLLDNKLKSICRGC